MGFDKSVTRVSLDFKSRIYPQQSWSKIVSMQMSQVDQTYQTAWTIARQLPLEQRKILARQLLNERTQPVAKMPSTLKAGSSETDVVLVALQQFSLAEQAYMDDLMARNNEGSLNSKERAELGVLVERYEQIMLTNSSALLRATQPHLFNDNGVLVLTRAKSAIRKATRHIR